jgi:hypothetical protein
MNRVGEICNTKRIVMPMKTPSISSPRRIPREPESQKPNAAASEQQFMGRSCSSSGWVCWWFIGALLLCSLFYGAEVALLSKTFAASLLVLVILVIRLVQSQHPSHRKQTNP